MVCPIIIVYLWKNAEQAKMLYSLTGANNLKWGQKEQEASESLKVALENSPVLWLPNTEVPFILDTEVSDMAIGAELCQIQNGEDKKSGPQQLYSSSRTEYKNISWMRRPEDRHLASRGSPSDDKRWSRGSYFSTLPSHEKWILFLAHHRFCLFMYVFIYFKVSFQKSLNTLRCNFI